MVSIGDKLDNYLYICIFLATLEELDLNEDDCIPNIYLKDIQIQNSNTIRAVVVVDDNCMNIETHITESEYKEIRETI